MHFFAVVVGDEAADELEHPDYQHVDLEALPQLVDRVLSRVVQAVVAGLSKTKDNKRDEELPVGEGIGNFLHRLLLAGFGHFDLSELRPVVELGDVVERI